MERIEAFWDRLALSPTVMRRLNLTVLLLLIPWTILTLPGLPLIFLAKQVWYVTLISHVALLLASLSAWQSARVEVRQESEENRRQEEEMQLLRELHDAICSS